MCVPVDEECGGSCLSEKSVPVRERTSEWMGKGVFAHKERMRKKGAEGGRGERRKGRQRRKRLKCVKKKRSKGFKFF